MVCEKCGEQCGRFRDHIKVCSKCRKQLKQELQHYIDEHKISNNWQEFPFKLKRMNNKKLFYCPEYLCYVFVCDNCHKWRVLFCGSVKQFSNSNTHFCSNKCSFEYRSEPGICIRCGNYVENRNSAGICRDCHREDLECIKGPGECNRCGRFVEERNIYGTCKECADMSKPGVCTKCGKHVDKRNAFGICSECNKKQVEEYTCPGICTVCGEYAERRNASGECFDCSSKRIHKRSEAGICVVCGREVEHRDIIGRCKECESKAKVRQAEDKMGPGKCKQCGKVVNKRTAFGLCVECNKKILDAKQEPGECVICHKYTDEARNAFGVCKECQKYLNPDGSFKKYTVEEILKKIEEVDIESYKEFKRLLDSIKRLENCNDELVQLVYDKANELDIPTEVKLSLSEDEILQRIDESKLESYKDLRQI